MKTSTFSLKASLHGIFIGIFCCTSFPLLAAPTLPGTFALVLQDQVILRAAARDTSQQHAVLAAGEVLEVRGERLDFLQVYDHRRERAGFVRSARVKTFKLVAEEAPELLANLRFVRDTAGSESLGIGLAAAWLKAAPAPEVQGATGTEVLESLGNMADRLAARASGNSATLTEAIKGRDITLAQHLDVARNYGLAFPSFEREGRIQVCYEGDALRRVMAIHTATAAAKARAALALTRPECIDPTTTPLQRHRHDQWRSQVLEQAPTEVLPAYLKSRLDLRRASVHAALAYQLARTAAGAENANANANANANVNSNANANASVPTNSTNTAKAILESGQLAVSEFARVNRSELSEDDLASYNDTAIRVGASRWAAEATQANVLSRAALSLRFEPGEPGQTCLTVLEGKPVQPVFRKCSYSLMWPGSLSIHAQGRVLSLAVQPTETWRELWLLRKGNAGWTLDILPPASNGPDLGYAEFAGFSPDATQVLVTRESRVQGRYKHSFEVLRLEGLITEKTANEASSLGAFQRWQDHAWKRNSVSLR